MLGVTNIEHRTTDEFCLVIFWDPEWACAIFIVTKKKKKNMLFFLRITKVGDSLGAGKSGGSQT